MQNRTHNNGELRLVNVGQTVELKGWVAKSRNKGGIVFIDLRDRYGITQLVVNAETADAAILETATKVRNEFVIYVKGKVIERVSKNPNMATGDVEIDVTDLQIISESETTPIIVAEETDALEDTRLKYRYLDLRRPNMQRNIITRHKVVQTIRGYLNRHDYIDIETPMLNKSTPEGARDYLVPSRVHPGEFYALPQSPQIFKQLCMVSGFEKYYQIARCFRDEDLRADRQPEFTQIDIEQSFATQEEILTMTEEMLTEVVKEVKGIEIERPFRRFTYDDAMERFGSDKPDTRFEMEIKTLNEVFKESGFGVFKGTIEKGGSVRAINVKGAADKYSRKNIDALTDFVKKYKAKGLAWLKFTDGDFAGPIAKFFGDEEKANLQNAMSVEDNDLLLFVADKYSVTCDALGALRSKLGKDLELYDPNELDFLWVVDWPLFEYDEEDGRYYAAHHPFTRPNEETREYLTTEPGKCKASAYDVVLNGYELGGGSLRIHERNLQNEMFKALGFSEEEAYEQFGFLLDAFKYGTPPHGGIALGIDRIAMILVGATNLREVIAFPKTASASDPMTDAPGVVSEKQLDELNIQLKK
ncbi:aspartate--tRNA ligase [Haloplasma contractile]|uniref:Aspartate--tRNA ligase n=1 Tax=Haloplasma contractile SSD-17B TaxID=1033810 RepID=F7PVX7_9MOLU|nr:aspartate--tRNA ligase [Haloplasma contractile]ERJ12699.1 Aspartate--tRNA ligase protein [Haloplasma contractile SSD-17B]